jgi:hypothetical protein
MKFYVATTILLPLGVMGLSWGIAFLIPGCTIDESAGASAACGAVGSFLATGLLGGFIWLAAGLIGLLPTLTIATWRRKKSPQNNDKNYSLNALEADSQKSRNQDI